jgi:hypothetical protein
MYNDNQCCFQGDVFTKFSALVNFARENIYLWYITNLNIEINHLAFEFVG